MLLINFIRSFVFSLIFYIDTIIFLLVVLSCKVLNKIIFIKKSSKFWAKFNILLLKYICGVNYSVEGEENIPNNNFLIVSKHQSTWETYFLFFYFDNYLACVVKKELLNMPGLGRALKEIGCIAIDRKGGANAMKKMLKESKHYVEEEKRNLLIFPQGTRVPNNSTVSEYPYRSGFVALAVANKLDLLPIALNSGLFWPKFSFIKKSGTIKVKILPVIKYEDYKNLNKNEITKLVEDAIENEQKNL